MSLTGGPSTPLGDAAAEWRCGTWVVERLRGSASELLNLTEPTESSRRTRLHDVERPALVLGSAQPYENADQRTVAAAGLEVVRRRSGGGAVLVEPGRQVWVDFFVPFGDALWSDDVGAAVAWVGDLWSSVVAGFVTETPVVHSGRLVADRWGRLVCFAGAGPGEVFAGGLKLVGVSQRRNRHRARIQTMARLAPRPGPQPTAGRSEPDFLALTPDELAAAHAALAARCGALPVDAAAVTEALLSALEACD